MKKFKIVAIVLCAVLMTGILAGCMYESEETQYTDQLKDQISDMYGYPNISNFFEYSQLKEIYEMRDNPNLVCYWYTKNDMSGKWIYQGTCVGYGIPYSASITAPESVQKYSKRYDWQILPLAEPNGLYTDGLSTSATWILTTDANGNISPTYVESEITISQVKMDARLCEDWSIPNNY